MTGIYAGAAVAIGLVVLLWLGFRAARKQGEAEQEARDAKASLDRAADARRPVTDAERERVRKLHRRH